MSWFNRKPILKKRGRKKQDLSAERLIFWCKRFGVSMATIIFIIWLGAWFFMSGASNATGDWARDKALHVSASLGFKIDNIMVEGRIHTDSDLLLSLMNVHKGDALFGVDLEDTKEQIEKISWVKSLSIKRQLPKTLHLQLEERVPMALWQRDRKVSVIDQEGVILTNKNLERFKNFIIFTGKEAPQNAGIFLTLLSSEPDLFNKVESAQYVSGRRWNLKLNNGLLVQLPEKEVALSLSQLAEHQEQDALLDKDIKSVDLRMFPSIIVQTHPGEAYSYKANYNSQNNIQENAI